MDGTLVNTHQANYKAYQKAIQEITKSFEYDWGVLQQRIQEGVHVVPFLNELGIDDTSIISQIRKRKSEIYPNFINETIINQNLINFVKMMKQTGNLQIFLVTTAQEVNAKNVLNYHHIIDLFDITIFGDGIKNLKPAPDIYLKALKIGNYQPEEVLIFEDSISGFKSAKAANISYINVQGWGQ
jgi:HAD superfamily hydrolase (TIGR01509 family)